MKTIAIAAALAAGLALPAQAQMGPPDPYGDATVTKAQAQEIAAKRFGELDGDKDGKLSMEERMAQMGGGRGPGGGGGFGGGGGPGGGNAGPIDRATYVANQMNRFDQMDGDKDGSLTKAERDAFRQQMMQRFQGGQ